MLEALPDGGLGAVPIALAYRWMPRVLPGGGAAVVLPALWRALDPARGDVGTFPTAAFPGAGWA